MIHCLDGVEKTGLFLCSLLMAQKTFQSQSVNLSWAILTARDANPKFITSEKQFEFLVEYAKILWNPN